MEHRKPNIDDSRPINEFSVFLFSLYYNLNIFRLLDLKRVLENYTTENSLKRLFRQWKLHSFNLVYLNSCRLYRINESPKKFIKFLAKRIDFVAERQLLIQGDT